MIPRYRSSEEYWDAVDALYSIKPFDPEFFKDGSIKYWWQIKDNRGVWYAHRTNGELSLLTEGDARDLFSNREHQRHPVTYMSSWGRKI